MRKLAVAGKAAAIAAVVLACAGAQAQVYKWVDSKGVTHYGEKPPENSKSKEVTLRNNPPPPGAPAPGAKDGKPEAKGETVQDRERAFRQRQTAREEAEARQAKERAHMDEQCKRARNTLADMRSSGRMHEMNDKGERVFLSDKQREDVIAGRQQEYDQHCK